jgi:hypothetical protein
MFTNKQHITEYVALGTLEHYFRSLDPCLCEINYFFPQYIFNIIDPHHRIHFTMKNTEYIQDATKEDLAILDEILKGAEDIEDLQEKIYIKKYGKDMLSLAIKNKCYFFLTDSKFLLKNKEKLKNFNIQPVSFNELFENLEIFLHGFNIYYKFSFPVYGIAEPDLIHITLDTDFNKYFVPFWNHVVEQKYKEDKKVKETIRTLFYNRYPDILITRNWLKFFVLQQSLIKLIEKDNDNPFHGYLRYYLNYYYYLLWGAVDHIAWVINYVFDFGFRDIGQDKFKVGLNKNNRNNKEFIEKVKKINKGLYDFIASDKFQDWIFILSKIRHKSAHRQLFSAPSLMEETKESKLSNEEISKIINKEYPEEYENIKNFITPELLEDIKKNDIQNYRLSKMKLKLSVFEIIKKNDGKDYILSPLHRIGYEIKILKELLILLSDLNKIENVQK